MTAPASSATSTSGAGVRLDQRGELQVRRELMQRAQPCRRQRANDEQDRRGTCGPRLEDLLFRQDEVLPQHRNPDARRPRRAGHPVDPPKWARRSARRSPTHPPSAYAPARAAGSSRFTDAPGRGRSSLHLRDEAQGRTGRAPPRTTGPGGTRWPAAPVRPARDQGREECSRWRRESGPAKPASCPSARLRVM